MALEDSPELGKPSSNPGHFLRLVQKEQKGNLASGKRGGFCQSGGFFHRNSSCFPSFRTGWAGGMRGHKIRRSFGDYSPYRFRHPPHL